MVDSEIPNRELSSAVPSRAFQEFDRRLKESFHEDLISRPPVRAMNEAIQINQTSDLDNLILKESVLKQLIPALDARRRIDRPHLWPFSVHGRVYGTIDGVPHLGSGTLIGSHYVLTAANNIYDRRRGKEVDQDSMRFIPSMNGKSCPYGEFRVIKWFYPQEFKNTQREDYALLVLDDITTSEYTGCYGLRPHDRQKLHGKVASIYGYPSIMPNQREDHSHLWGMAGTVEIDTREDMIYYDIDTSWGQSGSAVYYEERGEFYIIGIHIKDANECIRTNQATYMNPSRIERIKGWIKQSNDEIEELESQNFSHFPTWARYDQQIFNSFIDPGSIESSESRTGNKNPAALSTTKFKHIKNLKFAGDIIGTDEINTNTRVNIYNLNSIDAAENKLDEEGSNALSRAKLVNLNNLYSSKGRIGVRGSTPISRISVLYLNFLVMYKKAKVEKFEKGTRSD